MSEFLGRILAKVTAGNFEKREHRGGNEISDLENCKERLTEAQPDTKPASRRGFVMKSCVHSPFTGNHHHPVVVCHIYSESFTEATGGER